MTVTIAARVNELRDAVTRLAATAEAQDMDPKISLQVQDAIANANDLATQIMLLEGTKEQKIVTELIAAIGAAILVVLALILGKSSGTTPTPKPPKPPVPQPPQPPPPVPQGGPAPLQSGVHLTIVNQSARLSTADIVAYAAAQQIQFDRDFSPTWGGSAVIDTQPGGWPVYLVDQADVPNALGYHDEDSNGIPFGRVFVAFAIDNGVAWQSVASHEVLEMLGDPHPSTHITTDPGPDGCAWIQETGDPVEQSSYQINGIMLSDYVTPAWFTVGALGPYDFLQVLSAPFTTAPGGYAQSDCGGTIVQHENADQKPRFSDREYWKS